MPLHPATFTRQEVLAGGFEARCVGVDGARYIWHGDLGLRADSRAGSTLLLTDPARLPEGPWFATALGEEELQEGCSRAAPRTDG